MSRTPMEAKRTGNVQEIFPATQSSPALGGIFVKRSGWLRKSEGFHLTKFNKDYNLHFALAGRGVVIVDGVEHALEAGDVFMFYPGHRTEHYDFPGERWEYLWAALGAAEGQEPCLRKALEAIGLSEREPGRKVPLNSEAWSIMRKLHKRLGDGGYGELYPAAAAWRLLESLTPASGALPEASLAERLENYAAGVDGVVEVKQLAERFGVSRATLHRVFSAAYGESLKERLQRLRFESACDLLSGSELPLANIASATGFASVQYFCRAFKERFGQSPGSWRRKG